MTLAPPDPAPALGWWGHLWRFTLALAISAAAWGSVLPHGLEAELVDLGLGLVALVATGWRRRAPMTVLTLTLVLSGFSVWAAGPAVLASVSVATRRRTREVVAVALGNLVSAQVLMMVRPPRDPTPTLVGLITNVVAISAFIAWGLFVGSRRELLATLRWRAERAEADQELRAAQARLAERQRIAREMHDVLAHRITQVAMRTGAMRFREDLDAAALRAEAEVVEQVAHLALADLRGVLGALRDPAGDPPGEAAVAWAPQPTAADLPTLITEARADGLRVEDRIELDGPTGGPPDAVGRTVYRIVQEGLTNVRKHAPRSTVVVQVVGRPGDGVEVEVRNPTGFGTTTGSGTPGAGLGLTGLGERAALAGGRCTGGREGPDFVLRGWLPWEAGGHDD
ncbi:sensor histidine kinase [Nocardioides sp.]|uniref:sensor histidine kinase n=1 Tax=Nocardioides sp. TaxID=35761 RepID=UPI003512CB1A